MESIDVIREQYPECAETLGRIYLLRGAVDALPIQPFFEPVSLVAVMGRKRKMRSFSPVHVQAWRDHILGSSRVRMIALEDAVLRELTQPSVLTALVLLHSHMEVAGLAALTFTTLADVARGASWDTVEPHIRNAFFDAGSRREAEHSPEIEDMIDIAKREPGQIARYIEAMDVFAAPGAFPDSTHQLHYGILGGFAHPSMRGSNSFVENLAEEENGWILQYHREQRIGSRDVMRALDMLLGSMRIGHACSIMLQGTKFTGDDLDECRVELPNQKVTDFVLDYILQLPPDERAA